MSEKQKSLIEEFKLAISSTVKSIADLTNLNVVFAVFLLDSEINLYGAGFSSRFSGESSLSADTFRTLL